MCPVDDLVTAVSCQDDVGRIEVTMAEFCMTLHAGKSLEELILCTRIDILKCGDFLCTLCDRIAQTDCAEAVDLELDVYELLKICLKVLRLILDLIRESLSFDIFECQCPFAVELFYIQYL